MTTRTTRRVFLQAAGSGAAGLVLAGRAAGAARRVIKPRELLVYVGTYTSGKSEGIYLCRLRLDTGELQRVGVTRDVSNPSYLALDRTRRRLYAVNEETEYEGKPSGAVSAFSVERTGELRFINRQPSMGGAPCYVSVTGAGRFVLVANYVGGNVAVLPVRADGGLDPAADIKQGTAATHAVPDRQEAPHAHCIVLERGERHAYACDLGADKVMVYGFDARTGKLTPLPPASLVPGAGPRHLIFHTRLRRAYVLNELDSTVTVFAHDPAGGALRELQTVPALPADFKDPNTGADIHLTPDGRFLYCSNRGHDSLAIFKVEARAGTLTLVGHEPTRGRTPRNFAIDPTGNFLLAANQNSDNVVVFRLDRRTGKLDFTGHTLEVPAPVCLKLAEPFS
ncbi:MAG TPA: lactonase family protein [Pyrinomonadaceae bacterium]|nr:lactonase family protein [Pyrinomonadaceae bacterium]